MGFEHAEVPTCNRCVWQPAKGHSGFNRLSTSAGCPVHEPAKLWPVEECRTPSCRARIIWAKTERMQAMPVEADPAPDGTLELWWDFNEVRVRNLRSVRQRFGKTLHRSHFATCPEADKWRNRGGRPAYR